MNAEQFRNYCLRKDGVTEEFPFDDQTLVFKVMGKMFALCGLNETPVSINVKCDPEQAEILRARYASVQPGYHMNKKHWNTIVLDGSIPVKELYGMIDHSYEEVMKGLPKKLRDELQKM